MSKFFQKSLVVLSAVVLVLAVFGCKEKPAEKPPVTEKPEITIEDFAPIKVAYVEKKGPYSETGKSMQELFKLFGEKNLKQRNYPMGVYFDDPQKVKPDQTRYEVMCQFVGEFEGDKQLKVKKLPAQKVAKTLYVGPYEECESTYKKLYEWIMTKGYKPAGPAMEKYLNDISQVPPESLKTEICVPVTKMEEKKED
jgi:effector-binding domain-containing protein